MSTNPENIKDVKACAEYVENEMKSIGLEHVKIYETNGHPIVYGEWLKAGNDKPTILIYGHYDVQPVDPVELWTDPPFSPVIRDENIYARGATDDKGQVFMHFKSLQTHLVNNKSLPVNIKVLIEGEEEIGSVNLESFIDNNKELLKCDYVVISDTAMFDNNVPSICYGLRGLAYMQIEVTGPNRDLHSGSYGGAVDNPINALAHIICKLKNDNGKILIDGFYDDVLNLSDKAVAVNPDADNVKNLAGDYYTNTLTGKSEDFVNVYLRCTSSADVERPAGLRRDVQAGCAYLQAAAACVAQ